MGSLAFAILDVNTTGFFPEKGDRVVEISIVRVDLKGKVLGELTTLVNPQREVAMTKTHGITNDDVKEAPTFAEIAGDVIDLLCGTVLVGHNIVFDVLFLKSEFKEMGWTIPRVPSVCTLDLARKILTEPPSRQIEECCQQFGIAGGEIATANDEAKLTFRLFAEQIKRLGSLKSLDDLGVNRTPPEKSAWPDIAPTGKRMARGGQSASPKAAKPAPASAPPAAPAEEAPKPKPMPPSEEAFPKWDQYLSFLDQVLEDRLITDEEKEEMGKMAKEYGLTAKDVLQANRLYLKEVLKLAIVDGRVSPGERKDMDKVRDLLSISVSDYSHIMEEAKRDVARGKKGKSPFLTKEEMKDKTVCFAGAPQCKVRGMVPSRMFAEALAGEKGLKVASQLTRSVDFVIATEDDEAEDDIENAREMGIRVIVEPVFWRIVEEDIF